MKNSELFEIHKAFIKLGETKGLKASVALPIAKNIKLITTECNSIEELRLAKAKECGTLTADGKSYTFEEQGGLEFSFFYNDLLQAPALILGLIHKIPFSSIAEAEIQPNIIATLYDFFIFEEKAE